VLTANFVKAKGFRVDQVYEVLQGEAPIATLNETRFTFEHGEDQYSILRKGGVFPNYVLALGEAHLASAEQAAFRNKFTVKVDGKEWLLEHFLVNLRHIVHDEGSLGIRTLRSS